MQAGKTSGKLFIFGTVLFLAVPFGSPASAASARHSTHSTHGAHALARAQAGRHGSRKEAKAGSVHGNLRMREARAGSARGHLRGAATEHGGARLRFASYSGGGYLNCVAFAREETGMDISGNASTWWAHAAGLYERGSRPEVGAIVSFQANGHMPSGHIAVVAQVVSSREIEIDHANWWGPGAGAGRISRGIPVVDVSPNNDWTAVRVGLGQSGEFGSVYPINGFIYDRADDGRKLGPHPTDAALPVLNRAPRDLRSTAQRDAELQQARYEEVAEAPEPRAAAAQPAAR